MKMAARWVLPPRLDAMKAKATKALEALPWRPSLLTFTAGMAMVAAVANAVAAGSAPEPAPTRMGVSIQQSVGERDQALARQKRGLDLREQAMKAAEQRLKADLETRQGQEPAEPARGGDSAQAAEPYDDLARIYQTMKPARAAPIFERLDLEVQVQIAKRMRERSTALMMSSMSPNAAVELSMALAGRKVVRREAAPRAPERSALPPKRVIASAEPVGGKSSGSAPVPAAAVPAARAKGQP